MVEQRYERALVTGGAGLVGSNLVEDLLDAGMSVVSLDDLSAGRPENLDAVRDRPGFEEVVGDVTDREVVNEAMRDVDVVFHEAVSKNTVCMVDPNRDLAVNAGGTLNLLMEAVEQGVKKFVHASTGSVYGRTTEFPTTEDAPLAPVSFYGVSKLAAERYVHAVRSLYDLDTTILRYYHVFGPGQDSSEVGGVVPIFLRRALTGENLRVYGDGTQLRAFTYVKDVTAINLLAAHAPQASGQVFNCASDVRITIGELAERVLKMLGCHDLEVEYYDWKPGDIKHFDISNSKVKELLGFHFAYSLEDGLERTLESLRTTFAS